MNILFVVPYTPTPIRTRPYNLLRTLARRGNAITLATLWENAQERAALERLENQGIRVLAARLTRPRSAWNCLRAVPTAMPLQAVYCWQPELMRLLGSKFQVPGSKFDVVHIEHLRGARYGLQSPTLAPHAPLGPAGRSDPATPERGSSGTSAGVSNLQPPAVLGVQSPVLWDSVDCISHLFEQAAQNSRSAFGRLVTRFELQRTKKYEAWLTKQFDRVLVTSSVDAAALEALVSGSKLQVTSQTQPATSNPQAETITILPNGVDLSYFSPADAPREPATIVFSGKMSYHANVTAALHLVHDIMSLIWKERPNVFVKIVGQDPPSAVRKLVTCHPSLVTVTGSVPDLRSYLQRATLVVAPMSYGAGIQNKVLEAMACATPVVATSQAVSALQACPEEHFLLANEPADFARQILRLLDDRDLRSRVGQAGRRYVEQHHDWDRIVERLEGIYRELIG